MGAESSRGKQAVRDPLNVRQRNVKARHQALREKLKGIYYINQLHKIAREPWIEVVRDAEGNPVVCDKTGEPVVMDMAKEKIGKANIHLALLKKLVPDAQAVHLTVDEMPAQPSAEPLTPEQWAQQFTPEEHQQVH